MKSSVIMNGLPGKMATATAKEIVDSDDIHLHGFGLTGSRNTERIVEIGGTEVLLYNPNERVAFTYESKCTGKFAVDYTHPEAGATNAEFYVQNRMPFVMGTTSIDSPRLIAAVRDSGIPAVVAPNMALPIVAFQRFMSNYSSENFGALRGCELEIIESHQKGKADTSGTAKSMVRGKNGERGYFFELGIDFGVEQIKKTRDEEGSLRLGVSKEFLDAHGYHTYNITDSRNKSERLERLAMGLTDLLSGPAFRGYSLTEGSNMNTDLMAVSPQEDVKFCIEYDDNVAGNRSILTIKHNVNGRKVYAQGTLDALRFIDAAQWSEKSQGQVYSMIDVLKWIEQTSAA